MADGTNNKMRKEYISRINRVMDYIDDNLNEELTLKRLADVANFSAYHFHRIFRAISGETLNGFIQRRRVEKAADNLLKYKDTPVTNIAYDSGYSSPANFARVFKDRFGMNATQWRSGGYRDFLIQKSKNCKELSNQGEYPGNIGQACMDVDYYFACAIDADYFTNTWRVVMKNSDLTANVTVKELPEMTFAYIRNIGPYAGDEQLFERLFGQLCQWAGPRGLLQRPDAQFVAMYTDNPQITEEEKLRLDIGVSVTPDTEVDGEIGKVTLSAGTYAVASFEILPNQYPDAWGAVMGGWLPESGYQPDDKPCMEFYRNDPKQHPEGKHLVDIVVPVKPL